MAKEQTTQKWMGDQKEKNWQKPVSWQTTKPNRPKSQEENPIQPKTGKTTRDWLTPGYGEEPSMSPWEGHQKISQTGHNYTYNNPASLSKDTCESANPRAILRRRFNPRQVSIQKNPTSQTLNALTPKIEHARSKKQTNKTDTRT